MLSVYRRLTREAEGPCAAPGLKTPGVPRRSGPPLPGPLDGGPPDPDPSGPNSIVLVTRKFTLTVPGPRPKLRGSVFSSGVGFGSSNPYVVAIRPGFVRSVGFPGRPLKRVVP